MRRRNFSMVLALPAAQALSLANFQEITSILIPLSCLVTYDSQIPTCTTNDFSNGCSTGCVSALESVADNVDSACSGVSVSSNTLLGIILDGKIVAALCPTLAKTTTSAAKPTTSKAASSTANVVTIPTSNPGVTGGLGLSTSTIASQSATTTTSSNPSSSSILKSTSASTTKVSSSSPSRNTTSSTTPSSTDSGVGADTTTLTTSTSISTSSSKKGSVATSTTSVAESTKAQPQVDGSSGGGSPFDIESSASAISRQPIISVFMTIAWTGLLFGI